MSSDFGKCKITSIKYSDIKAFYISLIVEKGFKPNSMEIIHTILHPFFTLAVRDGYIRSNPAAGVMLEIKKSHDWEKPKRHALMIAEQEAFIEFMPKIQFEIAIFNSEFQKYIDDKKRADHFRDQPLVLINNIPFRVAHFLLPVPSAYSCAVSMPVVEWLYLVLGFG